MESSTKSKVSSASSTASTKTQTFTPRTSRPAKGNKYYITKASGGYSTCVKGKCKTTGKPDTQCDALANCFAGETEFITDQGLKTLKEMVNQKCNVLNEAGQFVPAEVKSFGVQQLYKISVGRNEFYVTANHRWKVHNTSKWNNKKYEKDVIKTTVELKSRDYIPYNYAITDDELDTEGIIHGMVFGDGNKNSNCSTYRLSLFGDKKELKRFVPEHIRSEYNLKEVPDINMPVAYLKGFIAGLLATDGTITTNTYKISNINLNNIQLLRDICYKCGIPIGKIAQETRNIILGGKEYKNHTIYYLNFKRKGIEKLLLKSSDLSKLTVPMKNIQYAAIKKVEPTDRVEEVYCVVEPQTETFTLKNNILTKNCVGYSSGRFNELIGKNKEVYALNCNAEDIFERAQKLGLQTGKTPKLGAIICWQKGKTHNTKDGCGHVAVVEAIYGTDKIMISQSGYNSTVFWNETLSKSNNYRCSWMGSDYKFIGFVYLPEDAQFEKPDTIKVDGIWGKDTTTASQIMFGLNPDGTISNQPTCNKKYLASVDTVSWQFKNNKCGSNFIRKLQCEVGCSVEDRDGLCGKGTVTKLQEYLTQKGLYKDKVTGVLDKSTVKAWQTYVNNYFKNCVK